MLSIRHRTKTCIMWVHRSSQPASFFTTSVARACFLRVSDSQRCFHSGLGAARSYRLETSFTLHSIYVLRVQYSDTHSAHESPVQNHLPDSATLGSDVMPHHCTRDFWHSANHGPGFAEVMLSPVLGRDTGFVSIII